MDDLESKLLDDGGENEAKGGLVDRNDLGCGVQYEFVHRSQVDK